MQPFPALLTTYNRYLTYSDQHHLHHHHHTTFIIRAELYKGAHQTIERFLNNLNHSTGVLKRFIVVQTCIEIAKKIPHNMFASSIEYFAEKNLRIFNGVC